MLATRGWKYRSFLRYLGLFKYLTLDFTRGEFLESYYTLMRYLDDVVDGDIPLPDGYTSESEYILKKIEETAEDLRRQIAKEKSYRNFEHKVSDVTEQKIREKWGHYIQKWNY